MRMQGVVGCSQERIGGEAESQTPEGGGAFTE